MEKGSKGGGKEKEGEKENGGVDFRICWENIYTEGQADMLFQINDGHVQGWCLGVKRKRLNMRNWIHLAKDKDYWRAHVNEALNLRDS